MKISSLLKGCCLLVVVVCLVQCQNDDPIPSEPIYPVKGTQLDAAEVASMASSIEAEVAVELADGLDLKLWAPDALVNDPIAISIAPDGRIYYTLATRITNSEFDIRGHRDWMPASISFQSVEDRRKFLRETFAEENDAGRQFLKDLNEDGTLDWKDLTVEKEQVWMVEDTDGDQRADRSQLYIEDFHEEITDLANGLEFHNGEIFLCVAPDLWRLRDRDGDGIADEKTSISHGFAVHIGFGAHGMSGAKIGPDGRIWWGIGDIGINVVDKEGKRWKFPNRGVIVRSELDGSNFEVYASGVRNTHEFVFDNYGNLISEDNDGDHRGERERLVYLINGSETGWRINWQFGKYTDPLNNEYKVWMDEKMNIPRWDGQAAYFLPPITNYVNGPTGMVHNPGTALGEEWYDHFFIAEFRGTPAHSPIHAFTLKPKGATFELDTSREIVKGLLPTGLDFGPDGALYFGDWIDGWRTKGQGRIWKLDMASENLSAIRQQTKALMTADFSKKSPEELGGLLQFQDKRIRQKAQFELVERGKKGFEQLQQAVEQKDLQLARIHGLWGMAQLARLKNRKYGAAIIPFLQDQDAEVQAQAAKMLGDFRYTKAAPQLLPLLKHPSLRVQLHAAEALGRMAYKPAVQPLLDMLQANNDEDAWLRHAGMIALGRIGEAAPLVALKGHESRALRIAAVVGLRRMEDPGVAAFLDDEDEYVVAEAARAINDDFSIEAALPALAQSLRGTQFTSEAFLRRAINANLRVGGEENVQILLAYAQDKEAPAAMRGEALAALSTWGKTSVFDRVDGRYRGAIERDASAVAAALSPLLADLLRDQEEVVRVAAVGTIARLQIKDMDASLMALLRSDRSAKVRRLSLKALGENSNASLDQALELAFRDKDKEVRSEALKILPGSGIEEDKAVTLFEQVLANGSMVEKQSALEALSKFSGPQAVQALSKSLKKLVGGRLEADVQLDVIQAVEKQGNEKNMAVLASYQERKPTDDRLALYREALSGGKPNRGREIFYKHEAAQCVRCHTIFEHGGNAGPGLAGVGNRLQPEQLLEAIVDPSATLAKGYGMVVLKSKTDETISGMVLDEGANFIKLRLGKGEIREVAKDEIASRQDLPSSMPPMVAILDKMQIRDVVAFLGSLK
ncbi:MAG: HEAT repeat domain-containing protein [Bacteroidota bacterium]